MKLLPDWIRRTSPNGCGHSSKKAPTDPIQRYLRFETKLIRYGLSLGYDYDAVLDAAGELIQTNDEPCDDF